MSFQQEENHCCSEMQFFLKEKKVAIGYNAYCHEYYIHLMTSNGIQEIYFCPWCGQHLPISLHDLYCDELKNQGYEPFDDNIPEKYKTDEWWRERGL